MRASTSVLVVDENDRPLHEMEKMEAHERGVLHRAFSAFVFQTRGGERNVLLQHRATSKYHFGGLWTNACCGHPLEAETPAEAGRRRLREEMNIDCELRAAGTFIYRAQAANALIEHELDHVLVGTYESLDPIQPDPAEADGSRWLPLPELERELAAHPQRFTPWFAQAYAIAKRFDAATQASASRSGAR